jgi:hypothetical protein
MATPTGVQKINTESLAVTGVTKETANLVQMALIYLRATDANVHDLKAKWPVVDIPFKPLANTTDGSFPKVDRMRCLAKAGALLAKEIDRMQLP